MIKEIIWSGIGINKLLLTFCHSSASSFLTSLTFLTSSERFNCSWALWYKLQGLICTNCIGLYAGFGGAAFVHLAFCTYSVGSYDICEYKMRMELILEWKHNICMISPSQTPNQYTKYSYGNWNKCQRHYSLLGYVSTWEDMFTSSNGYLLLYSFQLKLL